MGRVDGHVDGEIRLGVAGAHDGEVNVGKVEGLEGVVLLDSVGEGGGVDPVWRPTHNDEGLPGEELVLVGDHVLARVAPLLHLLVILLGPQEEHPFVKLDGLGVEIDDHVLAVIEQLLSGHLPHEPDEHCVAAHEHVNPRPLLGGLQDTVRPEQRAALQAFQTALVIILKLFIIVQLKCKGYKDDAN